MRKSRYTDSQIMAMLKQNEAGAAVSELCREHGMSSAQFYMWRAVSIQRKTVFTAIGIRFTVPSSTSMRINHATSTIRPSTITTS